MSCARQPDGLCSFSRRHSCLDLRLASPWAAVGVTSERCSDLPEVLDLSPHPAQWTGLSRIPVGPPRARPLWVTTATAAPEALASWTFFPALAISCLTSSGQPCKAGGIDVFILQRRKQRHREGESLARLTPQGRGPRGLGAGVHALCSCCPACIPQPSAARVLPHTAAGALLLTLGLLARCQSRQVVCLRKNNKIEILNLQGRKNPQMCFQPELYYLQM